MFLHIIIINLSFYCCRTNKTSKKNKQEEEECEGLAQLIPDIQDTAKLVHTATSRLRQQQSGKSSEMSPLPISNHARSLTVFMFFSCERRKSK